MIVDEAGIERVAKWAAWKVNDTVYFGILGEEEHWRGLGEYNQKSWMDKIRELLNLETG